MKPIGKSFDGAERAIDQAEQALEQAREALRSGNLVEADLAMSRAKAAYLLALMQRPMMRRAAA